MKFDRETPVGKQTQLISDECAAAIDRIVSTAVTEQAIPGLAILVAQDRRIIFTRGHGFRNLGERLPVDERTSFSIASISKQFTAAAIMKLCERGKLALTDSVASYLPWLTYAPDVTIAHLLTHTSGVPGYTEIVGFDLRCRNAATPREIVETVLGRDRAFAPGDDWQYSNTNYVLLGQVLEAISQRSYREIILDDLLSTLDVSVTAVNDTASIRSNYALGYNSYCLGPWEPSREWHPSWEFATAGLRSNVRDLFAWNVALRSGRIIGEASFRAMSTAATLNDGLDVGYGFGFALGSTSIGPVIHHSGGLPGFSLENTTFPDCEIDIIVLTNLENTNTQASITKPIAAYLTGEPGLCSREIAGDPAGRSVPPLDGSLPLLNDFLAGRIDSTRMSDDFLRYLTPTRQASARALHARGPITQVQSRASSRRDPTTAHTYRAECDYGPLRADLELRDGGKIEAVRLCRWDRS
jgi:D-alanyl-D-alanine carboxypeptidase